MGGASEGGSGCPAEQESPGDRAQSRRAGGRPLGYCGGKQGGDCPPSKPQASGRALGRALLTAGGHKPAVLGDTLAASSLGFC